MAAIRIDTDFILDLTSALRSYLSVETHQTNDKMSSSVSSTKRRKISKDVTEAPKLKSKSKSQPKPRQPSPSPSPSAQPDDEGNSEDEAAVDVPEPKHDEGDAPKKTFKDLVRRPYPLDMADRDRASD